MTIDFYNLIGSPPCAAALLAAKALDVKLNVKQIDYYAGDHMKPEFIKV